MFNFFSHSSSNKRYPDPGRGGAYYQRKGFFGRFGSYSRSGSGSSKRRFTSYDYRVQMPPNHGYNNTSASPASAAAGQPSTHSLRCPKCGTVVPDGSKFCLACGAPISNNTFCKNCGKPLPAEAKFCPECGTPR